VFVDKFIMSHFQLLQVGDAVVDESIDALLGLSESSMSQPFGKWQT
jgi:hypothetical protein